MRLECMLLDQPGTVVSSDSWTPVDVLTKQMIVDIEHAVNETFDRYEADGRFKGVVDRQQARGYLAADIAGHDLLPPGSCRAEPGTARGVGLALADAAKAAKKAAKAASEAAKKRGKRAGLDEAARMALATTAANATLQAASPGLTLPPRQEQSQSLSVATHHARHEALVPSIFEPKQQQRLALEAEAESIRRQMEPLQKRADAIEFSLLVHACCNDVEAQLSPEA